MGCACEKKYKEISKKYGDGNEYKGYDGIVRRFMTFLLRVVALIIFTPIVVVLSIPFVLFLTISAIIGKTPNLKLSSLMLFGKRQNK